MSALTGAQIRSGMKSKAVDLGPADQPIQRLDLDEAGPCASWCGESPAVGCPTHLPAPGGAA